VNINSNDGRKRVIIKNVKPEIDSGKFPIKRAIGDKVVVEADVFTDGHDALSCALLYVYNRLLSLNEVGGFPQTFGILLEEFHDFNKSRNDFWPHSLNATSTHDTKRGEDVRARLNVLSELPEEWERQVRKWSKINGKKKRKIDGLRAPDKNDEYFIYQTLIGVFPFGDEDYPVFVERIQNYVVKAVREAKVHTAWLKPDHAYEEACVSFVDRLLESSPQNQFLEEFLPFQKKVAFYGIFNSLSQLLLKVTSPGVPDFYQGAELWDLNLVDPDNRRSVDFEKRRALLRDIIDGIQRDISSFIAELLRTKEDGRIKLFLTYMTLKARNQHPQVFREGSYIPLKVAGKFRDLVVTFARKYQKRWAVTVAPRFLVSLVSNGEYPLGTEVWHDTQVLLPEGSPMEWNNMLTREIIGNSNAVRIGEVLQHFPVALPVVEERT
jgi:(1->4)-alpha-D-glucan 1-alpha-D-glucosylmutase